MEYRKIAVLPPNPPPPPDTYYFNPGAGAEKRTVLNVSMANHELEIVEKDAMLLSKD